MSKNNRGKFIKTRVIIVYIHFQEKSVQEVFTKQKRSKFMFCFAAYYYAIQLYSSQNNMISPSSSPVYLMEPKCLIDHVLKEVENNEHLPRNEFAERLLSYLQTLADIQQAEMLQGLGKGRMIIM